MAAKRRQFVLDMQGESVLTIADLASMQKQLVYELREPENRIVASRFSTRLLFLVESMRTADEETAFRGLEALSRSHIMRTHAYTLEVMQAMRRVVDEWRRKNPMKFSSIYVSTFYYPTLI